MVRGRGAVRRTNGDGINWREGMNQEEAVPHSVLPMPHPTLDGARESGHTVYQGVAWPSPIGDLNSPS